MKIIDMSKTIHYLGSLLLAMGLLSGCISTKKWKKDQYFLRAQSIEGNKVLSSSELEELYRQKTNSRVLFGYPSVVAYNYGKRRFKPEKVREKMVKTRAKYDTLIDRQEAKIITVPPGPKRERVRARVTRKVRKLREKKEEKLRDLNIRLRDGNWWMRSVGEAPVFYDSLRVLETAREMETYYQTKGFYQAKVKISTRRNERMKKVRVTYNVTEGTPFTLGKIEYITENKVIDSLLTEPELRKSSALQVGKRFDQDDFDKEINRIVVLLKNNGFYTFHKNYIGVKVDTSILRDTTKPALKPIYCQVIINKPSGKEKYHRQYKLDQVTFEIQPNQEIASTLKPVYNEKISEKSVKYQFIGKRIPYSSYILDNRVQLNPGRLYKNDQVLRTKSLLGALDMFKFINTSFDIPEKNNDGKVGRINARIRASPIEKYQFTSEFGLNVAQSLPGPFANLSLKNRNLFGGAEIFEFNFQFSIDGQTAASEQNRGFSSQEYSLNAALNFPLILFPTKLRFLFNDYGPKTRINLGYNFVNRPEYSRTNWRSSMSYLWFNRYSSYNLTISEVSLVNANLSDAFTLELVRLATLGNPLILSFVPGLVGSYYFTYTFNNTNIGQIKNAHYIKLLGESGGTTFNLIDRNFLGGTGKISDLTYFQFYRLNSSFHYYLPLGKKQKLAFRIHAGLARPYGVSTTLPYEKFYFAGGSNSVRAWAPRRLGPGAYTPPTIESNPNEFDYSFEQPGEIIMETSIEYRFPIYSFFEGALFMDAGNVWMIEDDSRLGSAFKFPSFLQELAVGVGFGLRLNFSFLLIRLDAGVKAYDPARAVGQRYILGDFNLLNPGKNGQTLLNLGIGYPF
ncbi:MAG TPA: hypothetical protein DCS93_08510 [Microscillaceae bacterium]|nr:hypothetical protein [Microscillaceae bacterium]